MWEFSFGCKELLLGLEMDSHEYPPEVRPTSFWIFLDGFFPP